MAGSYTFHNKFHRANHHTFKADDQIDAGLDPIASQEFPFNGIFYNLVTDAKKTFTIPTDSFQWWSAYTTVGSYSGSWMLTRSLYTTVSSLSNNWNKGYEGYLLLRSNSGNWNAAYTTVSTFSASWGSPYLMFTNKPQVYTHSKTFSGQNLQLATTLNLQTGEETAIPGLSTFKWDLNTQQIAFITLDKNIYLFNPDTESMVEGGLYTLVVTQQNNSVVGAGYDILFDTQYRFNSLQQFNNIVNKSLSGITVINFICVNGLMLGDVTYLNGNFV